MADFRAVEAYAEVYLRHPTVESTVFGRQGVFPMAKASVKNTPIPAEIRTIRGSRKSQFLRFEGKIPAVIYGHGQPTESLTLPLALTTSVIHSGVHIIELVLNGKSEKVLIKEVGYDYLQTTIEHVDLMRIDPAQRVKVKIPLEFRGVPKGAKEGGVLETQLIELELEVRVLEIPDSLRANVENLELHGILHAKDIPLPAGAKLINHPEAIVAQVRTVKEEVAAVVAEVASTEPEVIGKKKEEEGAEGAAAAPAAGGKAGAPAKK